MYDPVIRPSGRFKTAVLLLAVALFCGCDERASQKPLSSAITFHRNIAPIVHRECSTCHHPAGSAPFSLVTFDDVKKHATQIVKVTRDRFMPPWLPEPGYGHFADERRLTDNEIQLIAQWVDAGAPAGEPNNTPMPVWNSSWQLGQPDLVVPMPQAYTLAPAGKDVYRNFVVPLPSGARRQIRAVEFHPGNPKVIHHAFILFDNSGYARRMEDQTGEIGYEGMDAGEDVGMPPGQMLSWHPGRSPFADDSARAWRIPPGAEMVLQLHMRPSGKPESVQPTVGFYFSDKRATQFPYLFLLKSLTIDIPAGERNYVVESSYILPVDVDLLRIMPHAHYLGHELSGSATFPDGTVQPLILIKNWDFNWQSEYRYASPIHLPKGTKLSMRFTYDNSDANARNPNHPPKRVRYGPQSSDEMAELWFQVVPASEKDFFALHINYQQTYSIPDLILHYRRLLNDSPANANTRAKLGGALVSLGRIDEGISELRQAIQSDSSNATAHFNLAAALAEQGKVAEATDEYLAALKADPEHYRAHNNLGLIYFKQGRLDRAAHHFYNAVRLNPNDVLANTNLAKLFLAEQKWGQARLQLQSLLTLDPDNQSAQKTLAALQQQLEKAN